jgi:hypothetical protein
LTVPVAILLSFSHAGRRLRARCDRRSIAASATRCRRGVWGEGRDELVIRRLVSGHAMRIVPPPGNQVEARANAR